MKNKIKRELIKIIENVAGINITENMLDVDFEMVGINSLMFIQIIVNIEKYYKIEIDDTFLDITQYETLRSLIDSITAIILKWYEENI